MPSLLGYLSAEMSIRRDTLDQARSRGKATSCRFVELAIVAAYELPVATTGQPETQN
jgi:hypothetical protein